MNESAHPSEEHSDPAVRRPSAVAPRLAELQSQFDLIVIGGGITGAGIANQAARSGSRVLLIEQNDFASGTSSASSKLVHGGLRYLKNGQWRLTLESVRERNRLLRERPGLVESQPFMMPLYRDARPGKAILRIGLAIYDLMGGQWRSKTLNAAQALALQPDIRSEGLIGAVCYDDAQTDDARLTIKLILEAIEAGAAALNYATVTGLLMHNGRVQGVSVEDSITGICREINSAMVIASAGPWTASPDGQISPGAPTLRPLRGSHLIFPLSKLPVRQAVSWLHPRDARPVFVYPWEGAALLGTTDVDHKADNIGEPRIQDSEVEYLMEGLDAQFPSAGLRSTDAVSAFSGVRPVVAGGHATPSAESRESALWSAPGYIGITGGKLTTFRVTALQAMRAAAMQVATLATLATKRSATSAIGSKSSDRLRSRYGDAFESWLREVAGVGDRQSIANTPYVWGELRWALRHEQVFHLDDLLLRRTRLGLLMPQGGVALFGSLENLCCDELGWSAEAWQREARRYEQLWQDRHAVPQ